MISLRASGVDDNPDGSASPFVSIPVPVGVRDGDLMIVGITLPASGITVTPPSDDWTLIEQTDPRQGVSLVAFYATALNAPVRLVFKLSSSIQAVGGILVYKNSDPSAPIEVVAASLTASSASQSVAGVTASVDGEEQVVLLAAKDVGTFTAPGGYQIAAAKSQHAA